MDVTIKNKGYSILQVTSVSFGVVLQCHWSSAAWCQSGAQVAGPDVQGASTHPPIHPCPH